MQPFLDSIDVSTRKKRRKAVVLAIELLKKSVTQKSNMRQDFRVAYTQVAHTSRLTIALTP